MKRRFGHWKDAAIRLEGDAVWSMTVSFLSMWDFTHSEAVKHPALYAHLLQPDRVVPRQGGDGADVVIDHPDLHAPRRLLPGDVQHRVPQLDCPWDNEAVGQSVYLHLIYRAKRYVYITTPYLVIDYSLTPAGSWSGCPGNRPGCPPRRGCRTAARRSQSEGIDLSPSFGHFERFDCPLYRGAFFPGDLTKRGFWCSTEINQYYYLNVAVLAHKLDGRHLLVFEKQKGRYRFVGEYSLLETHQNVHILSGLIVHFTGGRFSRET